MIKHESCESGCRWSKDLGTTHSCFETCFYQKQSSVGPAEGALDGPRVLLLHPEDTTFDELKKVFGAEYHGELFRSELGRSDGRAHIVKNALVTRFVDPEKYVPPYGVVKAARNKPWYSKFNKKAR